MEGLPSFSHSEGKGFMTNVIPINDDLPGRWNIKEQSLLSWGKSKVYSSDSSLSSLTIILRLTIH
jgi:hypothetical protein